MLHLTSVFLSRSPSLFQGHLVHSVISQKLKAQARLLWARAQVHLCVGLARHFRVVKA